MESKKLLLICTESKAAYSFRKELITFFISNGFEVGIILGDHERDNEFDLLGVKRFVFDIKNNSKNILESTNFKKFCKKCITEFGATLILTFQIKANIFGVLAARGLNIPVISFVEGLGNPFIINSFKDRIIRFIVIKMYKRALKYSTKVIFLNNDDKKEFLRFKIVKEEKTLLLGGIGIDLEKYPFSSSNSTTPIVLNLARLIRNKGIFEFCDISEMVKKNIPNVRFLLCGSESELTKKDLDSYKSGNSIEYLGYINDPTNIIKESTIFVSTSYREGLSRSIMEAMALGRPVVSFDCIGNKDIIVDGYNGYLVKFGDLNDFAAKIKILLEDKAKRNEMGRNARKYCEEHFDANVINARILCLVNELLKNEIQ